MRITTCTLIATLVFALSGCGIVRDRFFDRSKPFEAPAQLPERVTRPVVVALDADAIIVGMDDGIQCLGSAGAAGRSNGWTGTLTECPYAFSYEVALAAGSLPGQVALRPTARELVIDETQIPFRPLAVVTVTDLSGQSYRFESDAGF